jgi:hypothetical protein
MPIAKAQVQFFRPVSSLLRWAELMIRFKRCSIKTSSELHSYYSLIQFDRRGAGTGFPAPIL